MPHATSCLLIGVETGPHFFWRRTDCESLIFLRLWGVPLRYLCTDRDIFAHRAVGNHRHERRTWLYGGSTRRYRVAQLTPPRVKLRGANIVPPRKRCEIIATLRLCDDRQPLPQSAVAARWSENSAYFASRHRWGLRIGDLCPVLAIVTGISLMLGGWKIEKADTGWCGRDLAGREFIAVPSQPCDG